MLGGNESNGSGGSLVPTPLLSDYIKMCFMGTSLVLGSIINGYSLVSHCRSYGKQRRALQRDLKTAFTLLKINLTAANLMVLLFYNTTHLGWLWTYAWLGGDALCRLTHFLFIFAFQASSNVVCSIALDRFRNVRKLVSLRKESSTSGRSFVGDDALGFVRRLLVGAWVSAGLASLPQLFLWGVGEVAVGWAQCISLWDQRRLGLIQEEQGRRGQLSDEEVDAIYDQRYDSELAYGLSHLLTVFWVPLLIASLCYCLLTADLIRLSYSTLGGKPTPAPPPSVALPHKHTLQQYGSMDVPTLSTHGVVRRESTAVGEENGVKLGAEKIEELAENEYMLEDAEKDRAKRRASGKSIPTWRIRMRLKLLRTAASISLAYVLAWLPYNVISLLLIAQPHMGDVLHQQADWLKALIILNALLNPFLYGVSTDR